MMKIPSPYFSEVPNIGNLYHLYTFYSLERPILFICKDSKRNLYICSCCELYPALVWVISRTSSEHLVQLIHNKCTIADLFNKGIQKFVIEWEPKSEKETAHEVNNFDLSMLPDGDELLDAEDGEFSDFENYLKIGQTDEDGKDTEKGSYESYAESGTRLKLDSVYKLQVDNVMSKELLSYDLNGSFDENNALTGSNYDYNDNSFTMKGFHYAA